MKKIKDTKVYKFFNKDVKEFNSFVLSFICIAILIGAGLLSYFMNSSYALFSDEIVGEKTIEIAVGNCNNNANSPVLSDNMIPVYYDETNNVWRKADSTNQSEEHKWYDYCDGMWANAVTVYEQVSNVISNTNEKEFVQDDLVNRSSDNILEVEPLVELYDDVRDNLLSADPGTEVSEEWINTMLVWIPRYKYTVWNYNLDGTVTSEPQEIQIEFESGTLSTGEIGCTDNVQGTEDGTSGGIEATSSETCTLKSNNTECTDATCNGKTYTHPAFTFGDTELTGFWVGKFETSTEESCTPDFGSAIGEGCNTELSPLVIPNVSSWRGAMVGTYDKSLREMNSASNIYGFATTDDTHMIKNMEWGAVTYLSHSQYGINKNVAKNSNTSYITGCGLQSEGSTTFGSVCNDYTTTLGQSASTTGNVYGVYDMNGGAWEYAMGNIIDPTGTDMISGYDGGNSNSGYTGVVFNTGLADVYYGVFEGTYEYPAEKYYDKYSFTTDAAKYNLGKLGDGTKEIFSNSSNISNWYGVYGYFPEGSNPWIVRSSDCYDPTYTNGVFTISNDTGETQDYYSTRLIVSIPN